MKRTIFLLMSILLLLTACGDGHKQTSSDKEQSEHKDNHNKNQVKQIATDKKVQGDNYRTILPFKESQARGLLQDNMANGYNGEDFESGLLELSKEIFPTNKYLYQDGQFLDKKTINAYLDPKYTKKEIDKMSEKEMRKIRGNEVSIIFQDPMTSLNPVYTIGNQITEVICLHTGKSKKEAHDRAKELLELVGINEPAKRLKQYPHELSGGMRQRVMIAIALACEPKLLIADEPTTALDVTIQAQILELMQELRKKLGMSIIMITHDLGVVASMCERIAVMYAGHIVEYGTADEIFYEPKHEYTKGLIKSIPKLNVQETERLIPIEGQPVDLLNPPAGCPFAPRCANCMKICLREMPPKTELSDTHYSQCWLLQKEEFEKGEISCE